ncbi:MAG: hypothetical protein WCT52_02155 [Candidatus Micrarchaeia archaeon]
MVKIVKNTAPPKLVPFRRPFKDEIRNVSCLAGDRTELVKMEMERFKPSQSSNFEGILYPYPNRKYLDTY